jgi:hypothetical protein
MILLWLISLFDDQLYLIIPGATYRLTHFLAGLLKTIGNVIQVTKTKASLMVFR